MDVITKYVKFIILEHVILYRVIFILSIMIKLYRYESIKSIVNMIFFIYFSEKRLQYEKCKQKIHNNIIK